MAVSISNIEELNEASLENNYQLLDRKTINEILRYGELTALEYNHLSRAQALNKDPAEMREAIINDIGNRLVDELGQGDAKIFVKHLMELVQESYSANNVINNPKNMKEFAENYCREEKISQKSISGRLFSENLVAYAELISFGYKEGLKKDKPSSLRQGTDEETKKRAEQRSRAVANSGGSKIGSIISKFF